MEDLEKKRLAEGLILNKVLKIKENIERACAVSVEKGSAYG